MGEREPIPLGYATEVTAHEGRTCPSAGVVFLLVGVMVLAGVGLQSLFSSPRSDNRRTGCAANLSAIGRSCLVYAESNNGHLPVSSDVLTYGGPRAYIQPRQQFCPACGGAYIYVPGHTNTSDPRHIVAYEPLGYHQGSGANVLRLDGSVKWLTPKAYAEAMEDVRKHLLAISNLPPHLVGPYTPE